jgi:choice-of-anchor B domain-containing protein|tara:strand:+ start:1405 stop:3369 length:1965 start_codon:yes stop_codon:yes gene_type:complete
MKKIHLLLAVLSLAVSPLFSQTPCENGMAGIYPCDNVDLMSTISLSELGGVQNMNDIWGWTDSDSGREFALIGMRNGTSFVEVTDPVNPLVIGFLATATTNSLWRDVKVFNDYAFVVSEAGGHGMQVFDLAELLIDYDEYPVVFEQSAYYDLFGRAHNIAINEASGYAYGIGTSTFSGGLHFVDISDPLNPQVAGGFGADGYTHDAQIVNYTGPDGDYFEREIAFCCNEDAVTIVDVTDKTDPVQISTLGYDFSAYTHQGWLTEDENFFIFNDEIDETSGFTPTTKTLIMDVRDLDNPVLHYEYLSSSTAIDHNLYTKGSLCYQSNYRSGLRILDIGNVFEQEISTLGFFDSQPMDDFQDYSGTWSNYAYFPSGTVIMSDMYTDFFILRPTLINAYRYAEVCANADGVEFYVDVTSSQSITSAVSTDFLPINMSVTVGDLESPGRIPVLVTFADVIVEGEYSIPITIYDDGDVLFSEILKIVVTNGTPPTFAGFSPVNGYDSTDPSVTIEWDAIEGADTYNLVISDTEDFSTILVDEDVEGTSYELTDQGSFYWKLIAPTSCRIDFESEVRMFSNNYLGVSEFNRNVKIYPNPALDELSIEGVTGLIQILSLDGRLAKTIFLEKNSSIDIHELASGTYVLQVEAKNIQLRFVKE